jgi:hypothetical protein
MLLALLLFGQLSMLEEVSTTTRVSRSLNLDKEEVSERSNWKGEGHWLKRIAIQLFSQDKSCRTILQLSQNSVWITNKG